MAKIRHIAITTRNVRATAEFFKQAFGMVEIPQRPDSPVEAATLSDGYINVTVLGWKEDRYGGGSPGLHHFGFHVEDLEAAEATLTALSAQELAEHNRTYGNLRGTPDRWVGEKKWLTPDGMAIDVNPTGWVIGREGSPGSDAAHRAAVRGVFLVERGKVADAEGLAYPACPSHGVVLRIRAGGVCGGDLSRYRHHDGPFPWFMGGHEYAGEVCEVGSQVSAFRSGDEAVFCFGNFCGVCVNCRLGSPNFCLEKRPLRNAGGGFAEYVAVLTPAQGCGLYHKPDGLSFDAAAVAEPAGCAVSAVERGQSRPGQWAAVVGLGAIGHFASQVLAGMGVRVIGIDVSENRLHPAQPFCRELVNSTLNDPVATVVEITGGIGVDQAYEVVGIEATLTAALQMTRVSGTTVLVGVFGRPMKSFHPEWVFRRDLTLIGAKGRPLLTAQGEAVVLDYIERGIIRPDAVVTEFPRSRADEAFAAQHATECLKAVLVSD